MKAERRHELQTNTLARSIQNLPEYWREHGSKLALALIAVLLAIVLVRMWLTNKSEAAQRVAENLSVARASIASLRDMPFWSIEQMPPKEFKDRREEVRKNVEGTLNEVLNETSDPARQAEAEVLRGDLYYELAMLGELPEATTRPDLKAEKSPSELIKQAESSYKKVVDQAASLPAPLVARARFGLAALAENQSDWDAATKLYEAIRGDGSVGPALAEQARARVTLIGEARKGRVIGRPRRAGEGEQPTTGPTTRPTTMPTTAPAGAPTTAPATTLPGLATVNPATSPTKTAD